MESPTGVCTEPPTDCGCQPPAAPRPAPTPPPPPGVESMLSEAGRSGMAQRLSGSESVEREPPIGRGSPRADPPAPPKLPVPGPLLPPPPAVGGGAPCTRRCSMSLQRAWWMADSSLRCEYLARRRGAGQGQGGSRSGEMRRGRESARQAGASDACAAAGSRPAAGRGQPPRSAARRETAAWRRRALSEGLGDVRERAADEVAAARAVAQQLLQPER